MEDGLISDASYWYGRVSEFSSSDWKVVCYQIIFHQINLIFIWYQIIFYISKYLISDRKIVWILYYILYQTWRVPHLQIFDIRPEGYLTILKYWYQTGRLFTFANIWLKPEGYANISTYFISDQKFDFLTDRPTNIWDYRSSCAGAKKINNILTDRPTDIWDYRSKP